MKYNNKLKKIILVSLIATIMSTAVTANADFYATEVTLKIGWYDTDRASGNTQNYYFKVLFHCQAETSPCGRSVALDEGYEYTWNNQLYEHVTIYFYSGAGIMVGYTASAANTASNGLLLPTDKRDYRTVEHWTRYDFGFFEIEEWHATFSVYIDWYVEGMTCDPCIAP